MAEILGGLWLLVAGLGSIFNIGVPSFVGTSISDPASCLLLLLIAVTPANIFMFTHGAKLPIEQPQV